MTSAAAWREFQRASELIHRVKEFGFAHPDADVESTLAVLHEPVTADNTLYAGIGLYIAEQSRDRAVRAGLARVPLGEGWKPNEKEGIRMDVDPAGLVWFKSSHSAAGACVQVAHLPDGSGVALRDSNVPAGDPHYFGNEAWDAFIAGVKDGEFDRP